MNTLTVAEAAYIAGFLDGEGSISFKHRKKIDYRISIYQLDPTPLLWIQEITGVGSMMKPNSLQHFGRQVWMYRIYGRFNCTKFLTPLMPYLIVKKLPAQAVLNNEPRDLRSSTTQKDTADTS